MRFGKRLRELRKAKGLTLRGLAVKVGVGFTYLSRAENERLQYGDYPSDALICKLAKVLGADVDELLLIATARKTSVSGNRKRYPTASGEEFWNALKHSG